MDFAEISTLSDEKLVHNELQLERDLMEANFRLRTGQLEDSSALGKMRKEIARARTAQRDRERDQGLAKNALRDQHRASFKPGASSVGGEEGGFLKGIVDKMGAKE